MKHPDAIIADVTSHAKDSLIKLSPFYPHGGIPVPFSNGVTATCVEAIWQGLKVFEGAGKTSLKTWRFYGAVQASNGAITNADH